MEPSERIHECTRLLELFKQHSAESGGVINEELDGILDRFLGLFADQQYGTGQGSHSFVGQSADAMGYMAPEQFQEQMDTEIAAMLKAKLSALDALSESRRLTDEEFGTRARILSFLTEVENDNSCRD